MIYKKPHGYTSAYTLVEIMIVIGLIALLAAMVVPGFLRARQRSLATHIRNDLRVIDSAVQMYAIETGKKGGDTVEVEDWTNYVQKDTRLFNTGEDLLGNDYGPQTVDETPFVPIETYFELGDVVDDDFWDPFNP
jgi:type II secretory pathway pseudopilin PulG